MNKVFTMKYDTSIIECISDTVSGFVSSIIDEYEIDGIFTVCFEKSRKNLKSISLCIVSNDLVFIKNINGIVLDNDICPITIVGVPTMCFYGVRSKTSFDRLLKSGNILYDREGSLKKIKKNIDNSKDVICLKSSGAVRTKPPIQYVKKS